jgi:hypothetical protein
LVDSDYISLGLKPHGATPTASGTPTARTIISYVTGSPAGPANKGFRIKTAYFAARIENEGKKGLWGPLTQALIP